MGAPPDDDGADRGRERDLVLAPNEFAFILDETKGNINVYVGPHKTSLANTDGPVVFDPETMAPRQRSRLGLRRDSLIPLSEHRPVIADFSWR